MRNLVKCKTCSNEIAKGINKCPQCGKDQRNFFMRHKILTFIGAIILIAIISNSGSKTAPNTESKTALNTTSAPSKNVVSAVPTAVLEATVITVDELMAALKDNSLKASKTFKGRYVKLTGKLSNIDSDGKYFSLSELDNEYSFTSILCNIKPKHLDKVQNFSKNQKVTVIGTISDVGEILGYSVKVESIF